MGIEIWLDNNCVIKCVKQELEEQRETRLKESERERMFCQNAVSDNNGAWTQKQEPSVS